MDGPVVPKLRGVSTDPLVWWDERTDLPVASRAAAWRRVRGMDGLAMRPAQSSRDRRSRIRCRWHLRPRRRDEATTRGSTGGTQGMRRLRSTAGGQASRARRIGLPSPSRCPWRRKLRFRPVVSLRISRSGFSAAGVRSGASRMRVFASPPPSGASRASCLAASPRLAGSPPRFFASFARPAAPCVRFPASSARTPASWSSLAGSGAATAWLRPWAASARSPPDITPDLLRGSALLQALSPGRVAKPFRCVWFLVPAGRSRHGIGGTVNSRFFPTRTR